MEWNEMRINRNTEKEEQNDTFFSSFVNENFIFFNSFLKKRKTSYPIFLLLFKLSKHLKIISIK